MRSTALDTVVFDMTGRANEYDRFTSTSFRESHFERNDFLNCSLVRMAREQTGNTD